MWLLPGVVGLTGIGGSEEVGEEDAGRPSRDPGTATKQYAHYTRYIISSRQIEGCGIEKSKKQRNLFQKAYCIS